ncbi:MAG: hypothetical protein JNL36_06515 [Candidatus Kapabacteria bacterium]|nr:hypothetical protein [Candidatus Kapabacteria bacterium]
MKKYLILLGILLFSYSISSSQGLSIKWEKKVESDTSGIQWMQVPNFAVDKDDDLLLFVENSKMLPAFIWVNSNGEISNFQNYFYQTQGSNNYIKLALTYKYATNISFSKSGTFAFVTLFSDPINNPLVQELYVFEVPKLGVIGSYFQEGSEEDFISNPTLSLATGKAFTLLFFPRGRIQNMHHSGKTIWRFRYPIDSILFDQAALQPARDIQENSIVLLSGKDNFSYFSLLKDTIYSFQIRKFGIVDFRDSLYLKVVFTFTQYDFGLTNHYLIPKNIFVKNDNYIVVGNLQMVNDTTPYFDNGKQFIATITKQGEVVAFKQLESPFFVNEACLSKDSTKIAMLGFEYDKSNLKNRKLGVVEYDLETENVRKVIYADSKGVLFTSSIRAYSNGDYAVTTSANGDSVVKNGLTPFFYVHRITNSTTSVDETKPVNKTTVRLEPNPTSEYATVRFLASEEMSQVNLVDSKVALIRNIYTKDVGGSFESSVTFRVSDLANGMYYVVVGNGTKTIETVPLSIQR